MFEKFLYENSTSMRLARTIVQGILSVVIANLDLITGLFALEPSIKPMLVALIMAILSPIMSEIGKNTDNNKD